MECSKPKKIIIAIDGFSSCGKSTFAKTIAAKLGYIFILSLIHISEPTRH